jgi:hypothetical protein
VKAQVEVVPAQLRVSKCWVDYVSVPVPIEDEMSDTVKTAESRETTSGAASGRLPKELVGWPSWVYAWPSDAPIGRSSRVVIGTASSRGRWRRRVIGMRRVGRDDGNQRVIVERWSK